MTSIGGRSRVPRRARPVAVRPRIPVAEVGAGCPCVAGTATQAGPFTSHPGDGQATMIERSVDCTSNMVVSITVTSYDAAHYGGSIYLGARVAPGDAGFYLVVAPVAGGPPYTQSDWLLVNPSGVTIDSAVAAIPAADDVLALSVVGSAIVGRLNGSTIVSATETDARGVRAAQLQTGEPIAPSANLALRDFSLETVCP